MTPPDTFPAALARGWLTAYTRLLMHALALRETARGGWPSGRLRELLTDAAAEAVTLADQLRALGHTPTLRLAGAERELWRQVVRYDAGVPWRTPPAGASAAEVMADAARADEVWRTFAGFVARLPDEPFATSPALDPAAGRPGRLADLLAGDNQCAQIIQ